MNSAEADILEVDKTLTANYTSTNEAIRLLNERVDDLENNTGSGSGCSCPSDVESRLTALENNSGNNLVETLMNPLLCDYEDIYLEIENTIFSATLDAESLSDQEKKLLTNYNSTYKLMKSFMLPINRNADSGHSHDGYDENINNWEQTLK
jgi:hypothetical protein